LAVVTPLAHIRNFSIIAHIDHGKSTLADRILEQTGTVAARDMKEQLLDKMELERERGITIKSQAVRISYTAADGQTYQLNLIDTPGHVDFTYEVSRSLAACEGAVLLVDATQGVEAQTVANAYLAIDNDLEIIPVLNKIDLPAADVAEAELELHELTGATHDEILVVSAKTGEGVRDVLEAVVQRTPPPEGDPAASPRALIFDSEYDQYRGVIAYVRVVDGAFAKHQPVTLMSTGQDAEIEELGFFHPEMTPADRLETGEVGYIITGVKDVAQVRVGDTITDKKRPAGEALPGYKVVQPMVFTGLFPTEGDKFEELRDALEKLKLNDAALLYEPESSVALGFGFRCGFLGLLHMDIVRERLEREYGLELITTMPSVEYHAFLTNGTMTVVRNPSQMPDANFIDRVEEPYVSASILVPSEFVGAIMELCQGRRADFVDMKYLSPERVEMHYKLPLAEIVLDFFDQLKTRTRGYASLDYEYSGYRASDLVKLDVLLAGEPVDALSLIIPRERAHARGKALVTKLRQKIPRQLFEVPVQAAIGNKVVARETVKAVRKDVTAKCYGGDITRKRKLLEKQKEGKKRMKQLGVVEVPQEAFLAVLELEPTDRER
jgi:GTP-binding protein LepA